MKRMLSCAQFGVRLLATGAGPGRARGKPGAAHAEPLAAGEHPRGVARRVAIGV